MGGDGCEANMTITPHWICKEGVTMPMMSVCQLMCGDGMRDESIEECDDGNRVSGDGCSY